MKPIVDSLKVLGESTKMFESLRDNLFKPKELKFNSQICTTREQSERLLALGLKKETADMWYPHFAKTCPIPLVDETLSSADIPAWSLHRLIEMALKDLYICGISFVYNGEVYEKVIGIIENQIHNELFPKQYLNF
jgi:hypothetical protein